MTAARPLTVAVLALGGQGGGVLSNWLLALAEANGYRAQTTSVPGVAQRTGATVYYLELFPEHAARDREPVLALMPSPGAVDLVVAAELMEAGRAIQRGFVSRDSVLIASSHRAYAVAEKSAPGDATADSDKVLRAAGMSAGRFLHADMAALAERAGSVISAALFGAVAASGALPFSRAAFEQTVRAGGVGVEASLRAFTLAYDAVTSASVATSAARPEQTSVAELSGGSAAERRRYRQALERLQAEFPAVAVPMLTAGLNAVVDFQDAAYGHEYLDRLLPLAARDGAEHGFRLTVNAGKYLARAMAYDDVIRVAELKTRAGRPARVRREVNAGADQLLKTTEFFHPRLEEVCATLPVWLGRALERRAWLAWPLRRLTDRGRRLRSDTLGPFLLLYCTAGLRRWRRGSLRHRRETEHLEHWLRLAQDTAERDYPLAVEVLRCRRLIKGYSDTYARGLSKYDRVLDAVPALTGHVDGAAHVRLSGLIDAALADEDGAALDAALRTLAQAT